MTAKLDKEARQKKLAETIEILKKVRASKTISLKPSKYLRQTLISEGIEVPFSLRYYQVQGAYHLMVMKRMVLGDDTGTGKTVQAIAAFAHLLEKDPKLKIIVITPKATIHQWAAEIKRFCTPEIVPLVVTDPPYKSIPIEHRKSIYKEWFEAKGEPRRVLVMNYSILIRDYDAEGVRPVNAKGKPDPKQPVVPGVLDQFTNLAPDEKLLVILDECQAVNNPKTKTWEKSRLLCDKADRVQGLTATPIGSVLMEAFGIYKVIKPELFKNKTSFMNSFCEVVLQGTPHSKQKIPIVTGYKNLEIFRESIDPFFLGRMKQDISDELPTLISRIIPCELSNAEDKKYKEALSGILELGDGEIRDFEESKALVALLYCQQVANSLSMLKYQEGDVIGEEIDLTTFDMSTVQVGGLSAKEQALVDLLVDGELSDQKVIVYTRFASLVPRLQKILDKHKIGNVRVTGKDSDKVREAAKKAFQDPKAKTKVIFVTAAGGVGINLQIAKALVFFELPWTWGDYVQILGRMIRIGSPHRGVVAYHLFAERLGGKKTIDHHVHKLLLKKKELIDKVIGEAAVGALEFEKGTSGSVKDLLREMLEDA